MPNQKPQPLMVDGKAYYSLSSYEPVDVEVEVFHTTEADVDYAVESLVKQMGATPDKAADAEWIKQCFGADTPEQFRQAVHDQVAEMAAQTAEAQKINLCVAELASRLNQSVPEAILAEMRQNVRVSFEAQLMQDGLTLEQFLQRTGASQDDLDAMFARQAQEAAEQEAALDAYAREKKLKVTEAEFGPLLGMPVEHAQEIIDQARQEGELDALKEAALHSKAAQAVVSECHCTYVQETPEDAAERISQFRELNGRVHGEPEPQEGNAGDADKKPKFRLV